MWFCRIGRLRIRGFAPPYPQQFSVDPKSNPEPSPIVNHRTIAPFGFIAQSSKPFSSSVRRIGTLSCFDADCARVGELLRRW